MREIKWCRGLDLNQWIPKESDLQSDAFDHSATSAYLEPKERFELSTYGLQNRCSDQLSYFGLVQRKFIISRKYSQYGITRLGDDP